jgi:hypothetical protein
MTLIFLFTRIEYGNPLKAENLRIIYSQKSPSLF